jgi:hypothetical protein
MTTKRKARLAFTDDGPTTSKAICHDCLDLRGITSYTVPYIMENGRPDSKFRKCEFCAAIIPVKLTRHLSDTQPLGASGLGKVQFEVVSPLRSRSRRNRQSDPDFEITKFGNKEDIELKEMYRRFNSGGMLDLSIASKPFSPPQFNNISGLHTGMKITAPDLS